MHLQLIDDDFFDSLRLGHDNFLSPAIRLRLSFVSIQQSPFLRLLFRFHKDRSQVGLLPITKLRPYYICILLAVDNLQVDSPSHEFIDKPRIVALINEHFHLLLPLEVDSSDSIVAQDLFKENLLMRLLFFRSRLLYCLSLFYLILMGLFLPRHPSEKLGANEVKRGICVRQRSFKVPFVLDDIVDGVYFGQLQKGFLLSEVGERVLAQYGTLERRVASYRIILVMDGFKVLLAFGTSLLHQQKTFIEFEIQRYLLGLGGTVGVGESSGTQGKQSGSKREGRKGGID